MSFYPMKSLLYHIFVLLLVVTIEISASGSYPTMPFTSTIPGILFADITQRVDWERLSDDLIERRRGRWCCQIWMLEIGRVVWPSMASSLFFSASAAAQPTTATSASGWGANRRGERLYFLFLLSGYWLTYRKMKEHWLCPLWNWKRKGRWLRAGRSKAPWYSCVTKIIIQNISSQARFTQFMPTPWRRKPWNSALSPPRMSQYSGSMRVLCICCWPECKETPSSFWLERRQASLTRRCSYLLPCPDISIPGILLCKILVISNLTFFISPFLSPTFSSFSSTFSFPGLFSLLFLKCHVRFSWRPCPDFKMITLYAHSAELL